MNAPDPVILEVQTSALLVALHARDLETSDHTTRVTRCALLLAREFDLTPTEMRLLRLGARLHDIGKIGVADAVLRKPGRLTDAERAQIERHPLIGAEILTALNFPEGAIRVVAEHHERWDGTGYPVGLCGEAIDLKARIFQVVDTFDAITCDRCYRAGAPYAVAAHEINEWSGRQFDPEVVNAFLQIPRTEWQ